MRLLPKLTLGILAASAVPLAVAGISSARLSERSLRTRIESDHLALATNAADGVGRFFDGLADALTLYPQLLDLEAATPNVLPGDQVLLEVVPLRKGASVWKMRGEAKVAGQVVCEAEFLATLAARDAAP